MSVPSAAIGTQEAPAAPVPPGPAAVVLALPPGVQPAAASLYLPAPWRQPGAVGPLPQAAGMAPALDGFTMTPAAIARTLVQRHAEPEPAHAR
ncbi:hypothetical protein ACX12L_00440 [Alicycliphilus sp. T452]|jgi:hypothetical protein